MGKKHGKVKGKRTVDHKQKIGGLLVGHGGDGGMAMKENRTVGDHTPDHLHGYGSQHPR
ncbi:pyruvate:ferredoxin [Sesbania bispinosa]|nr:pyruvate:ferredoxin [Sesbania bispinosa]